MISSYPKVYAIGHGAIVNLLKNEVLVEEKIDGSQFSFGKIWSDLSASYEIKMRSRGAEVYPENPAMFALAAKTVSELAEFLHPNWTYRAEFLMKPKHNVLAYTRTPKRNLILFDVNPDNEVYLSREDKEAEAQRLGIEIVPVLAFKQINSPEVLLELMQCESVLGGKIEGIVVKNYSQFGEDKKCLMGKYVSEAFKESHVKEWRASNPEIGDIVEQIIKTLKHERRWEKAVERLRDAGKLDNSPKDIGILIKSVQEDIQDEEADFIGKKLTEWAMPKVMRAASGGVAEWYKERLMKSAFQEQETT